MCLIRKLAHTAAVILGENQFIGIAVIADHIAVAVIGEALAFTYNRRF